MNWSTTFIYAKRATDVLLSLSGLIVLAPIALIIGIVIWLDDRRPIFFSQTRIGQFQRPFRIWKFRTLRQVQHDPDHPMRAATRSGRVLRISGLDEIPQLWNVLIGDMSLVGPRPTIPEQVAQYETHQLERLLVKPGITGLAQVSGRTAIPWPERIELDREYIREANWGMDIAILLATIRALSSRKARETA